MAQLIVEVAFLQTIIVRVAVAKMKRTNQEAEEAPAQEIATTIISINR